jgi:hypothetical protein
MDRSSNVNGVKDLFVEWTGGTSPTVTNYDEVVSVAYSGTGVFLITFSQAYNGVRHIGTSVLQASYSASGAVYLDETAESATNGTVTLTARTAAGAAVAPASTDIIRVVVQVGIVKGSPS